MASQFVGITLVIINVIVVININWKGLLASCPVGFGDSLGMETITLGATCSSV